ncbi:MAG: nicotinamide riboside transporter PnuC [Candidatus Coproplasma sp.]
MKDKFFKLVRYFTPLEWSMWLGGVAVILTGFFIGADKNILSLVSALLGVSCVIFNAKGSVWGQIISVGFAFTYAAFAYTNRYYGETIIYLALMLPIHVASIISWLRNKNDKSAHIEVKINKLSKREYIAFVVGAAVVSVGFYFLLYALNTDNLIVSTISLVASMGAAYLMLRRCEYFSLCFIANDLILLVLWSMKIPELGTAVVPSLISFALYLINDSYSFFNWKRIKRRQQSSIDIEEP